MASVERTPHGTYRVRYRDAVNRTQSKTFKRKAEARSFAVRVEADKQRGELMDSRRGRKTVGDWSSDWLTVLTVRERTKGNYLLHLNRWVLPHLADVAIVDLDRATVRRWVGAMEKAGAGFRTMQESLIVLRGICEYAIDARAIRANPASRIRLKRPTQERERHFLTAPQVRALADAMPTPEWRLMVLFTAYTGLRAGEVEALRVRRLDIETRKVDVVEAVSRPPGSPVEIGPTKTYARRTVPLPRFLAEMLADHIAAKVPSDLVFTSATGLLINHRDWYAKHFKPAVVRAGLDPGVRFHDLRHTCAALLIGLGAHPRAIMERLGHRDITTTLNTYGHLFPHIEAQLTDRLQELWDQAPPGPAVAEPHSEPVASSG